MDTEIMGMLYKPFALKERKGHSNMTYKYVANEDVIDRMNRVFNGCWSTKVVHKEVIDDQVLLEVRISVYDPTTSKMFIHTGFGSHPITRFTSGQNTGRAVDIGNSYKSALAKGIVNACTRWGVGLYKESDEDTETSYLPDIPTQEMPGPPQVPTPVSQPIVPRPNTPNIPNIPVPPNVPVPKPAMPIKTPSAAVPPSPAPVKEVTVEFPPPVVRDQQVAADITITQAVPEMPKIPAPGTTNSTPAPPTPDLPFSVSQGLSEVGINNVQRVALNGILSMNNVTYEDLATEAFRASGIDKPVPPKESLKYDDAVVIIKFGNDKYRKYKETANA
jgi:hypothetical protein